MDSSVLIESGGTRIRIDYVHFFETSTVNLEPLNPAFQLDGLGN